MNGKVEVTWLALQTISHSIMVHIRVSDKYIHFALIYMTDHIFPVLSLKKLINQDSEPTTPHKMETSTKPSVSNLRVKFCPCGLQKATAHVDTKALKTRHQSQKGFVVSLLESHNIKKGTSFTYLVHGKLFLHMTLYLAKYFLVRSHTHHVRIQGHSLCNQQYFIFRTIHHLMNKLVKLYCLYSLKRGV